MHVCVHIHIETREGIMRREKEILRKEEKKTLEYRQPENRRGSCLGEVKQTVSWATRNGPEQSTVDTNI